MTLNSLRAFAQSLWGALVSVFRRPRLIALAITTAIISLLLLFVPQFNLLNYYFSFAVAVVVPLFAALVAVRVASDLDGVGARLGHAAVSTAALLAIPLVVVAIGSFWVMNCDIRGGLVHYALGPGVGALFGLGLGLFAGTALPRRWATLTVLAVFVVLLAMNLRHFYLQPPISAYNHFAGFWAGAIYDDNIAITRTWALFRAYSACLGLGLIAGSVALEVVGGALGAIVGAAAPLALVFVFESGQRFDLSREDIAAELGGVLETEHFVIHYPTGGALAGRIAALGIDHEFRWAQLRDALDLAPSGKIHSFLYENERQKQALIGAGATFIAKPWTREMHLNAIEVGASVLKHEMAHVFGAELNTGVLAVPTTSILFPKMGLIEGFAVALESTRSRLTVHQWSAAMRAQGIAPPMQEILRAEGFLGTHSGKAYTLAGSFLRFLLDSRGLDAFRSLYRTGDFDDAYDTPIDELIAGWEAFVDDRKQVPLTKDDEMMARFQFDQPSRFRRVCALEVAEWEGEADSATARGERDKAVTLYRRILSFEPNDPSKRYDLLDALIGAGALGEARTLGKALATDDSAGLVLKSRTRVRLADVDWLDGKHDDAQRAWAALVTESLDESTHRRVIALDTAAHRPVDVRDPIVGYLVRGQPSGDAALALLRTIAAAHPDDPLPAYLLGRRADGAGLRPEAERALAASLRSGLAPRALAFEAQRLRAMIAFADGHLEDAAGHFGEASELTDALGQQLEMKDWADRCAFMLRRSATATRAANPDDLVRPPGAAPVAPAPVP